MSDNEAWKRGGPRSRPYLHEVEDNLRKHEIKQHLKKYPRPNMNVGPLSEEELTEKRTHSLKKAGLKPIDFGYGEGPKKGGHYASGVTPEHKLYHEAHEENEKEKNK